MWCENQPWRNPSSSRVLIAASLIGCGSHGRVDGEWTCRSSTGSASLSVSQHSVAGDEWFGSSFQQRAESDSEE